MNARLSSGLATGMLALVIGCAAVASDAARGTADLGIVVERAAGRVQIIETTDRTRVGEIADLGDLSHASANFSRDGRYAFVFGRDGGLSKLDLLEGKLVARVVQAGNSIGGAISEDGTLVAVSNYEPGGVKVFDSKSLEPVADIPAVTADGTRSKVVGLVDAPGQRFVFSLYDAGEIWIADFSDRTRLQVSKFTGVGAQPYDAFVTSEGRYYIAGLFGEDALVLLELWRTEAGPRKFSAATGAVNSRCRSTRCRTWKVAR